MRLEVLYLGGCPSYERLLPTLRELASKREIALDRRPVESDEDAERGHHAGS